MTLTLFGISNCDTVKRARSFLGEAGIDFVFHDFKKQGLLVADAEAILEALGVEKVLNKRGTTWRKLSDSDQVRAQTQASALITEHTSLIKRPVWRLQSGGGTQWRIGFAKGSEQEFCSWINEA